MTLNHLVVEDTTRHPWSTWHSLTGTTPLSGRPFVIDIDRDAIRREWSFNVGKRDRSFIILEAMPRTASRKQQFHQCLIRIDPQTYRVSAIKYVDASQKFETVYVLRGMSRSPSTTIEGGFDPHPNVKGFRLVTVKFGP